MKMTLTIQERSFDVEVGDLTRRPVQVWVNGKEFEVWPEELTSSAAAQPEAVKAVPSYAPVAPKEIKPAPVAGEVNKAKSVVAPIPGVIVSVGVKAGDSVAFGQELCVLEAMKMKNQIRANRAGTVASVNVATGDQVRQNQVLLEYTD